MQKMGLCRLLWVNRPQARQDTRQFRLVLRPRRDVHFAITSNNTVEMTLRRWGLNTRWRHAPQHQMV